MPITPEQIKAAIHKAASDSCAHAPTDDHAVYLQAVIRVVSKLIEENKLGELFRVLYFGFEDYFNPHSSNPKQPGIHQN